MRWYWYVIIALVCLVGGYFVYLYFMDDDNEADKMAKVREAKAIKNALKKEEEEVKLVANEPTASDTL